MHIRALSFPTFSLPSNKLLSVPTPWLFQYSKIPSALVKTGRCLQRKDQGQGTCVAQPANIPSFQNSTPSLSAMDRSLVPSWSWVFLYCCVVVFFCSGFMGFFFFYNFCLWRSESSKKLFYHDQQGDAHLILFLHCYFVLSIYEGFSSFAAVYWIGFYFLIPLCSFLPLYIAFYFICDYY
jgi:hypothetical protein